MELCSFVINRFGDQSRGLEKKPGRGRIDPYDRDFVACVMAPDPTDRPCKTTLRPGVRIAFSNLSIFSHHSQCPLWSLELKVPVRGC